MTAYIPGYVKQLDGSRFAGVNCTCAVGAMLLDRETLGKKTTTAAKVRSWTGDTSGGTTQRQVATALAQGWAEYLDVETPIATATAWKRLDEGQAIGLGGQSSATRGTKWSASPTFGGNHQWADLERRRNSQVAGGYEHRIMDPLGDGRRAGIANFGPNGLWVPENLVLDFARRLDLDGQGTRLGYGKLYAVFTHDTEPHLVLRYGAKKLEPPYPGRISVPAGQKANVRNGPGTKYAIVLRLENGARFIAYQATTGKTTTGGCIAGQCHWYGNIDGSRWIHQTAY